MLTFWSRRKRIEKGFAGDSSTLKFGEIDGFFGPPPDFLENLPERITALAKAAQ